MAGHSKWATIKRKKGATDAKRAKEFTKLQKEIFVAAKLGDKNPDFNPRLRSAVIAARAANMPKDRIESNIKRADSAGESENYDEMRYEGYAPGGIAIIVEALTDNRNRTAANVRSTFSKFGGSLGETGSVSFMFERVGYILYNIEVASEEEMFESIVEAGADSMDTADEFYEITTTIENFAAVRDALIDKYKDPEEAKLTWQPKDSVAVTDAERAEKIMRLIERLEDDDDVQSVIGNFEIPDEIMESMA